MKSSFHKIHSIASPVAYIGLDNLKVHLGIFGDDGEDMYLSSLLLTACDLVSDYVGKDFGSTGRQEFFKSLDDSLELARTSTSSLTVHYYNTSETLTVLDSTLYVVDTTSSEDVIRFKTGAVLPTDISDNMENPVVVGYTSLMTDTQVPEAVIQATYMFTSELYNNRNLSSDKKMNSLPLAAERLLAPMREVRL